MDAELTEAEGDGSLVMVPASLIGELSRTAGTRSLGQELFSRDGKIEEYLRITDQEKAAVQTAWKSSRQRIRDLEATSSKSEDLEDNSVKITVPDLTNGMGVLGEDFKSSVKDVLGGNRGEVFLEMKQVKKIIAPPAGERIYTLKVEPTGDGGWRYHTVFENAGERRVWVGASVPNEIRHLTDAAKIFPAVKQAGNEDGEGE